MAEEASKGSALGGFGPPRKAVKEDGVPVLDCGVAGVATRAFKDNPGNELPGEKPVLPCVAAFMRLLLGFAGLLHRCGDENFVFPQLFLFF